MLEKSIIGVRRYMSEPFGMSKKVKVYTYGKRKFRPILDTLGKPVYEDDFYNIDAFSKLSNNDLECSDDDLEYSDNNRKIKGVTTETCILPYNMQPVYMITELHYHDKYNSSVFVEAKFHKYVTYEEWKNTPLYDRYKVNWIH